MIIETVNDTGIALYGAPNEKLRSIKVYIENGAVQLWIETRASEEVMQYLSPTEAMALSRALDRLAIESLRAKGDRVS